MDELKPIFTIMPDFGYAFSWTKSDGVEATGGVGSWGWKGDAAKNISGRLIQDFIDWQDVFENEGWTYANPNAKINWDAFHARGIQLARRLKAEVGDQARVVYEKPCEDPNHQNSERREILACVFHANWTPIPRQTGQSERSDAGVLVLL